jgi:hypothetical protein
VLVAAATGLMWVAVAGGPATAQPTTQDFAYTGGEQSFVVPAGVCSVTVDALGAEGGANSGTDSLGGSLPGLGGEAQATITVTPGETLTVVVGGRGGDGQNGSGPGAGGFNGGGAGGNSSGAIGTNPGSGGGGASDVRRGTDPLVVAGGGGGAGNSGTNGGAGGGDAGTGGTGNLDGQHNSTGGGGGTQASGGAAGANSDTTVTAEVGTAGQGGAGATGGQSGGGGGGGGWFGGGGGGLAFPDNGASAGGGGGSGYLGAATGTLTAGVHEGDGAVSISYEPSSSPCSTPLTPLVPAPVVAPVNFTG